MQVRREVLAPLALVAGLAVVVGAAAAFGSTPEPSPTGGQEIVLDSPIRTTSTDMPVPTSAGAVAEAGTVAEQQPAVQGQQQPQQPPAANAEDPEPTTVQPPAPTTTAEPVPGGPPVAIPTPTPTYAPRCVGPEDQTPGCIR